MNTTRIIQSCRAVLIFLCFGMHTDRHLHRHLRAVLAVPSHMLEEEQYWTEVSVPEQLREMRGEFTEGSSNADAVSGIAPGKN